MPVTTFYTNPRERVNFWPERDANPFHNFFEGLWMLGGRNDVDYVAQFVPKMLGYSDDGETLHGAYGHRWRKAFSMDQLQAIANALKADPTCRRQVLQMWHCDLDLVPAEAGAKDLPCNTHVYFTVAPMGALDMTVCNRSNDIVWGCYGSDVVHFSMLQEVLAAMIGIPVGFYWHVSNNWHGYRRNVEKLFVLGKERNRFPYQNARATSPYEEGIQVFNMVKDPDAWFGELDVFLSEGPVTGFKEPFFRQVAVPMWLTWQAWKDDSLKKQARWEKALDDASGIMAPDWRLAVELWLQRRGKKQ